jgi:curli biogenesis system outer membrane secretion channel CsgG
MVRDDAEQVQIFISAMVCEDMSTKSTELHQVTLMLGVREIFDGVITGKETINDIGDQVETLLASDLAISGWFTVEQHLKRTQFTEISDRDRNEIIKTYIYNLIIQKDG